jgi:eukaryotic-like serine/threonine-protein kinase
MEIQTTAQWEEFASALRAKASKKARYIRFYRRLDVCVPGWASIVSAPQFQAWALHTDPETGCRISDMLYSAWADPAWSAPHFAALVRLFQREAAEAASARGKFLGRLLGHEATFNPPKRRLLAGRYVVLRALGSGGNGDVFLVWSRETEAVYALKIIKHSLRANAHVVNRFKKEIETWVHLGVHPNIVRAFFLDVIGDSLYMTMEYIDSDPGPTLADRLQNGPVREEELPTWFAQIVDGLSHAYRCGVTAHRDLKPANILIDSDGTAKVSDFGLVCAVPVNSEASSVQDLRQTAIGATFGTPAYMPPEQWRSARDCDYRSDMYSFGVTMYQAISGRLPFMPGLPRNPQDIGRFNARLRHMHESEPPSRLDTSFWPLIERCLKKRPDDRFTNMAQLRQAIAEIANTRGFVIPEVAKADDDIWSFRDKGNTLLRLGKYEDALIAFDKFVSVMPDSAASFNRAVCLENLGRTKEALEEYKVHAKMGDYKAFSNGAECFKKLRDLATALEWAHRATEMAPTDTRCWITYGNMHYAANRMDLAASAYQRARELEPSDPTAHYNLALARKYGGDEGGALRSIKRFLDLASPLDERRAFASEMCHELESGTGRR